MNSKYKILIAQSQLGSKWAKRELLKLEENIALFIKKWLEDFMDRELKNEKRT